MGTMISAQVFLHPPPSYTPNLKHLIWIEGRLPAIFLRAESAEELSSAAPSCPLTILFSHGNAEDLGCVSPWLKVVRERCGINILAYEYRGYGLYDGPSSEEQCYHDIQSAYRYLLEVAHIPASRIVLFGRSLGTGPTIHLASTLFKSRKEQEVFPLAGVILQSPLTSCISVVSSALSRAVPWLDLFVNCKKMGSVMCPILILHGTMDEVVPYAHGIELSRLCPNLHEMVSIPGAKHNDIEEKFTAIYFTSIKNFVNFLSCNQSTSSPS